MQQEELPVKGMTALDSFCTSRQLRLLLKELNGQFDCRVCRVTAVEKNGKVTFTFRSNDQLQAGKAALKLGYLVARYRDPEGTPP